MSGEEPTCIYLEGGTTKDPDAPASRVGKVGAAVATGRGLGPFPYSPRRSYRPGRTAEWPPG